MYTFSQLLLRNIFIGIIFSACAAIATLIVLSEYFNDETARHQRVITSIAQEVSIANDRQLLGKSLQKINDYNQLTIKTFTGEQLFTYTKRNPGLSLPAITPPAKSFSNKTLDLTVEFQLDFDKETKLTLQVIGALFLLSNIFIIFASGLSIKKYKTFFQSISQQIKNDLANINNEGTTDENSSSNIFEIPELKDGISEIRDLISNQISNSSALEKEAYTDSLTQLQNRGRFVQFYENEITKDSPIEFGVLLITRCSELQTINQIHGYREGDIYISNIADIFKAALVTYPSAKIFRLNSSDFACIIPNVQLKEAEGFAQELTGKFNEYQQAAELDSVAFTGLVYFDKTKPLGELLALADTGISVAQTQNVNAWYSQKDTDILKNNSINYGNQNWRQEIESVIENQRVSLLLQPIQPNNRNSKVYGEVLARFLNSNEEMLPTASFIAMAEKLDKIVAVDRLIIESAINEIINKNLNEQSFGINVSARSINDEHFLIWLERRLLRESSIAPRLVFEITENGLQQNIKTSKRFIDMIHRVGSRVTVERFGVGLTSFKFFRDLKPDFIKMDSTYTRDIDEDKNNQYFLRLMVDLAHRLSIGVLAESVESQEEKHTLGKLFIDGCQGFYIGKPEPL